MQRYISLIYYAYSLQALERDLWKGKVTVVSCDMREWNSPENADIMVSELLGSFGDNELSPECLYGIQRFLKRTSFYYITNIINEIFQLLYLFL